MLDGIAEVVLSQTVPETTVVLLVLSIRSHTMCEAIAICLKRN